MLIEPGRRVHFVGVGGAGMSAIAKVLLEMGAVISGSDLKRSRAATMLEAMGVNLHVGHDARLVENAEAVVVSSAIPDTNPEIRRAGELGIEVWSRGRALAEILSASRSVVIAGTHGKTTTTSMAVSIFRTAGLDPTYLVGGGLNDVGTNARFGRGAFAIAESDESDGSFLLLRPEIAVITNLEIDHVDYWDSIDALRAAFTEFTGRVPDGGAIVVPHDNAELVAMAAAAEREVVTFGTGGNVDARDIAFEAGGVRFTLCVFGDLAPVELRAPGMHNVLNALAAAAAAHRAGIGAAAIAEGLAAFRGVERRFEVRGSAGEVTVIDDYAHHPTEVRATLTAAQPGPWRRVVAVFQPHRYSRTAAFASAFGDAFGVADQVVITDVYGAGETPVPGVSGKLVADAVCHRWPGRSVAYLPRRAELVEYLARIARPGDAVVTLGAGDVGAVGDELLVRLRTRS
ncbi:MAG TPA: UDP-N-acetylmuramate--L-alanine ligase [Actinomycetota bacterium]|nr:UDP-N-acetylmuramate--L-alanine ligase [Actinomycetota bacterium]